MLSFRALLILLCAFICYRVVTGIQLFLRRRRFAREYGCQPVKQFPQPDRILGLDWSRAQFHAYKSNTFLQKATERYDQAGLTFSGTTLGRNFLLTIDTENVRALLATNFSDFGVGARFDAMGPFLGSGIFTTDGKAWEHSRALVRPNFNKAQINDLNQLETHVQHLIARIPKDGTTVDLQPLFFGLTIDSATAFLFGESCNFLLVRDHGREHEFVEAYEFCQQAVLVRTLNPIVRRLMYDPKFKKACHTVHAFVDKYVDAVLQAKSNKDDIYEEKPKRYVFLEELAKETRDPKVLRDEMLNVLLAGRDTTASLLSNTFHILARRPDVWQKLRAEIDGQLGGELPSYEKLRDLKYVKYVLNEALRLYPVVPMNTRFANKDTTLPRGGGPDGRSPIFVPAGTGVTYHVWSLHRRRDVYGADVMDFKPERWETVRPGWAYLPFNGGPRICPGQQFALTEASYTVVRLVQHFSKVESRDHEPWKEALGLTTASLHGTKVSMTSR